jgi:hypothetical protein
MVPLMVFDWSPYFGAYSVADLLGLAVAGVAFVGPLIVVRLGYRWAFDVVKRVVRSVS